MTAAIAAATFVVATLLIAPGSLAAGTNLLTNGDFEAFTGKFTPNPAIAANNSATWNKWMAFTSWESVDDGSGTNNIARQDPTLHVPSTTDITQPIKQAIDGSLVPAGSELEVSFTYASSDRQTRVEVWGLDAGETWQPFPVGGAPLGTCTGCTLLYSTNLAGTSGAILGHQATFLVGTDYKTIALGIHMGGRTQTDPFRFVDDVTLKLANEPPDCSAAAPSAAVLWPPQHQFVPITITGVTDPDGDPVTITVDSIFQDEAVDAPGSGNTGPDGQGVGTSTAEVRAERVGTGNGRVYHISFTASDGLDSCTGTVRVSVPKSLGRNGAAVDDGALFDSTI